MSLILQVQLLSLSGNVKVLVAVDYDDSATFTTWIFRVAAFVRVDAGFCECEMVVLSVDAAIMASADLKILPLPCIAVFFFGWPKFGWMGEEVAYYKRVVNSINPLRDFSS